MFPHKDNPSRLQKVTFSPNLIETEKVKENKTGNLFQLEEEKTAGRTTNETEINNSPEKEFKAL